MITLIRWWIYKTKEIKWKCALWQYADKQLMTLAKNPEMIEKKIMPYLAETIHKYSEFEKFKQQNGEYGEKQDS